MVRVHLQGHQIFKFGLLTKKNIKIRLVLNLMDSVQIDPTVLIHNRYRSNPEKRSGNYFKIGLGISHYLYQMTQKNEQPNNPLHGVKLVDILEFLVATYGWKEMSLQVDINCFKKDPTIKSSLKFLRRTPWAREKVEQLYLQSI